MWHKSISQSFESIIASIYINAKQEISSHIRGEIEVLVGLFWTVCPDF